MADEAKLTKPASAVCRPRWNGWRRESRTIGNMNDVRNKEGLRPFYNPCMNHHTLAVISITGTCLDVLGSLYLAYDLLGGQHGPLRLLTRIVTYSIVFGIGYGIGLGFFFGVACGATGGITVAIELHRTGRRHD